MRADLVLFAVVDAMLEDTKMEAWARGPAVRLMSAEDALGQWRALWWGCHAE